MSKALILLTGSSGQLGSAIQHHWEGNQLKLNYELLPIDMEELDLTDEVSVRAFLGEVRPEIIINGAAYTDVDGAETDRDAAFAINAYAVLVLAEWCALNAGRLIQISTDFVFDGSESAPYLPRARMSPLSVYGASKMAGENYVNEKLKDGGIIVRTSWLYSEFGSNFVKTMLRLMGERQELRIVRDQIGSPTSAHTLTKFIVTLIDSGANHGVFHWTDGAQISWLDFAQTIYDYGRDAGLLSHDVSIIPTTSAEYPTPASRPAYSALNRCSSLALFSEQPLDWRGALKDVIDRLKYGNSDTGAGRQ